MAIEDPDPQVVRRVVRTLQRDESTPTEALTLTVQFMARKDHAPVGEECIDPAKTVRTLVNSHRLDLGRIHDRMRRVSSLETEPSVRDCELPESLASVQEIWDILQADLPVEDFDLILWQQMGYSQATIGALLDVSQPTVSRRLKEARRMAAEVLNAKGV